MHTIMSDKDQEKETIRLFLEKRKEGKKAVFKFFEALDMKHKKIVLDYQLDEITKLVEQNKNF